MIDSLADVPTRLNGYPIVNAALNAAGSVATVMVRRTPGAPHPFVVASWHPSLHTTWSAGSYFDTEAEATKAFVERIAANARRC